MKVIRPLQLSFMSQVLEQDRRFYFIATATLGVRLTTAEALLETDTLKDAFACMGDKPRPDLGMPKPKGEFLVSGNFFSKSGQPATGGEVMVRVGAKEKKLYVFGPRVWTGSTPGGHQPVVSVPLDFQRAFGGKGYPKNPDGIGFKDGLLPQVEDPKKLIASPGDTPDPAGFAPLDCSWPQRMRFQGTYDENYKYKFFPGYPADLDWRFFMNAPEDQWLKDGYWNGDETFSLHNMHPDLPVIAGKFPTLQPRCFLWNTMKGPQPELTELLLNLDTIWFFPEKLLAYLFWRKGIEVADDEAKQITHALLAYEDRKDPARDLAYYRQALDLRMKGDDPLLDNLNTEDLVPVGHLCAMEILQKRAFAGDEKSELAKNIDAKAEQMRKLADDKVEDVIQQSEKNLDGVNLPDDLKTQMPDGGKVDLRQMIQDAKEAKPDPDLQAMNQKLETIIPGITGGDPAKIELKKFSFDKIDQIMDTVSEFSDKKQKEAMALAGAEIAKAKDQVKKQLNDASAGMGELPAQDKAKLEQSLKLLEDFDLEKPPQAALPRLKADEILAQLDQVNPQVTAAMQHLQAMKDAGVEDENTRGLEDRVKEMMSDSTQKTEQALREAEKEFKGMYIMAAHFMMNGLSPHPDPVETVTARFLAAFAKGEDLSEKDWACLDLSGQDLNGVDLSGAFLEQVNFKGASLKGANLAKAILARAVLDEADFTDANFAEANVGGVHAHQTNFTGANLKSAKLSKGDFTGADFTRAELEDIESLEFSVNNAVFAEAHMPGLNFIKPDIIGARFGKADLSGSAFLQGAIKDADFTEAKMTKCTFADMGLENVGFDRADLTGVCFAVTDPEKVIMKGLRFPGALLKQANFQGLDLKGANFVEANLESANFGGADLEGADLRRAFAKSAMFRKARLARAKLDEINLMEGSLAKAYLVEASFWRANLFRVDFLRSTITNTDFREANLDSTLIEHWRPK